MDIGNALRRAGRDDIVILSTIANTVKEIYTKDVEIQSVKMRGKKIIITTGRSLVNSELQLLEGEIKKASLEKLEKLGIRIGNDKNFRFA